MKGNGRYSEFKSQRLNSFNCSKGTERCSVDLEELFVTAEIFENVITFRA